MENPLHGTKESPHGTPPGEIAALASLEKRLHKKTPLYSGVFFLFKNLWSFTLKNPKTKNSVTEILHFSISHLSVIPSPAS